jgi:hypothetical protein
MDEKKRAMSATSDGQPPRPGFEDGPAPGPINPVTGQHEAYWVLSEEERKKGFVRPVRLSYKHIGPPGPQNPLRDLTEEEQERYAGCGYVKYEEYPHDEESSITGKFWTQAQLDNVDKGCNRVTSMGLAIAETYARDPSYYGATFCIHCQKHLPIGKFGEFIWQEDGTRVGT